jgi:glycosyltransferase involved in cell wall biosynthesis
VKRSRATDVTIVIPTRNRLGYLTEAIESIRSQTLTGWEVVVVDDASDDGSTENLEELLADDPRLHLIALPERSERSTARNTGLGRAAGRYILFLDDDDRLVPKALERLVAALERNTDAVVAIGARRFFDPQGQTRRAPHPRFHIKRRLTTELLLGWVTAWVAVPGQCLMRTQGLREAGGWNKSLVGPEDQELLLRLTEKSPAVLIPPVVLEYRLHPNQWRPPDVRNQEDAFRFETASRLADAGDRQAMGLLQAGNLLRDAGREYDRWEYRRALNTLRSALAVAPVILASPIVGPAYGHLFFKSSVGAVSGRVGSKAIRSTRERVRQLLSRSPNAQVRVLEDARVSRGSTGNIHTAASFDRERADRPS